MESDAVLSDRVDAGEPEPGESFVNRELSWLQFARRVLALAEDPEVPLLERVKFAGIMGMLHDEFFMKRISGLKRQIRDGLKKISIDGLTPEQELAACHEEIRRQVASLGALIEDELRPALAAAGLPILDYDELPEEVRAALATLFTDSVLPILTPLAVDAEHPFPFISNLGLNLAVTLREGSRERFIRIKVPANRDRWIGAGGLGWVPLEQIIAAHLDRLFPRAQVLSCHSFRVTRSAQGERDQDQGEEPYSPHVPGSIIDLVANELKARRFAGEVRLQVSAGMPQAMQRWLVAQLELGPEDVYETRGFLGLSDLSRFAPAGPPELRYPRHEPATHERLRRLDADEPSEVFAEIRRGEILLHHPYHCFDTSVLRFLQAAAVDECVLAIKLTIYRTSSDSPIVRALTEAARRGKQVAVMVEITARFDEAPNIAWGRTLENEGVHVAYGVEKLKTHVKLAMVVREEADGIRRYVHVGTGNYHSGTARAYEDLGILSADPDLAHDVSAVFNELTSAAPFDDYRKLLVAPRAMRRRFVELIRREAGHAAAGRTSGIVAKMNQLQDPSIIRELYRASRAGVPITLYVRGLCSLRPGVPGLSETIRVASVIGRFLEHGRIYTFVNGGSPEYLLGSADWMKRNLDRRVETITPVTDPQLQAQLQEILEVYARDNHSAWDMQPDGSYLRRRPQDGERPRAAQDEFIALAQRRAAGLRPVDR